MSAAEGLWTTASNIYSHDKTCIVNSGNGYATLDKQYEQKYYTYLLKEAIKSTVNVDKFLLTMLYPSSGFQIFTQLSEYGLFNIKYLQIIEPLMDCVKIFETSIVFDMKNSQNNALVSTL